MHSLHQLDYVQYWLPPKGLWFSCHSFPSAHHHSGLFWVGQFLLPLQWVWFVSSRLFWYKLVTYWICSILTFITMFKKDIWSTSMRHNYLGSPAGWCLLLWKCGTQLYCFMQPGCMMLQPPPLPTFDVKPYSDVVMYMMYLSLDNCHVSWQTCLCVCWCTGWISKSNL